MKNVDAVTTISETSKKDIVRFLPITSDKVHNIYDAPVSSYKRITNKKVLNDVAKKYHLPEKFVLYLGDVGFNKNIPGLVKACMFAGLPLVIVGKNAVEIDNKLKHDLESVKGPRDLLRFLSGKPHPEIVHFRELESIFKDYKNILRLGFVPEDDLVTIMNLASVYCHPAFYEGFGLGVVNAFACGTAVVISKTQALVEIASGAALIADPKDPKDIAVKITEIMKNKKLKNDLIEKGPRRAKDFSWQESARKMIDLYKQVAGK